ncbi:hypothetical protein [Variovorax sp. W6]|uniref:hypothetical protein n=1 Tax=Variovorax sp. W6 TaxID=3093895 RepID=UPI003D806939
MNSKSSHGKAPPADPAKKDTGGGKTRVEQDGDPAPRLPHEHDQSSDSQQTRDGHPPRVGRQAHEDVERGLVDTDRALEADNVEGGGKVRR